MAVKVKTWVWIVVGILAICILGVVAMAGAGFYFFSQHFDTKVVRKRGAGQEFDGVKSAVRRAEGAHRARRARPLPPREHRPHRQPRTRRRPDQLYVLAFDPDDERMVKVDDSVLAAAIQDARRHRRLQRRPAGPRRSEADGRGSRALRSHAHRRSPRTERRTCPRLVPVTVLYDANARRTITARNQAVNPAGIAGVDSCASRQGSCTEGPMNRFSYRARCSSLPHSPLAAPASAQLSGRPDWTLRRRGASAIQRSAAGRVRQRLSRGREGRRKRRPPPRRVQLSGRSAPGSAPTRVSPQLRRSAALRGSRSALATRPGYTEAYRRYAPYGGYDNGSGGVYQNRGYGYPSAGYPVTAIPVRAAIRSGYPGGYPNAGYGYPNGRYGYPPAAITARHTGTA